MATSKFGLKLENLANNHPMVNKSFRGISQYLGIWIQEAVF